MIQFAHFFLNERNISRLYLIRYLDDCGNQVKDEYGQDQFIVMCKLIGEEPFELTSPSPYDTSIRTCKKLQEEINLFLYPPTSNYIPTPWKTEYPRKSSTTVIVDKKDKHRSMLSGQGGSMG